MNNTEQKKLNIAMVCDPIGGNKSGVVVSTMRFAKLLGERGHKVIFIGAKSSEHKNHSLHDNAKAYRFRSMPVPKSDGWNLAFPTVRELKKIFTDENIDIVHIILPMSGSVMAIKAARSLGIKIVAHSHSQPENLFMDAPKFIQPTLNHIWNLYLSWTYDKAESLIYPSEMARGLLDKLSKNNKPSHVISNGINTQEFKPILVGDFYDRFDIPKNAVKLLFVGRLFPEKSVDTLIRAIPHIIEKYPDTHIMIVGGGHLKSKLEKLTHEINVNKFITFLGLVSEEDKILAYNASDIFILPSLAELEGMVVLEAMACGKPIIISDSKMSASRFFVNDNGYLFETKNPKDLAEKAIKLISNEGLRTQMGNVSLEKSKSYDIQKSTDALEAVYYLTLKK
ncbi:MAG: glycosyltransferase [Candidatus Nomurabacteria bacterium]|nr:glycosyltransferase [Candidatus Nomurabacteria bacterium]